MLTINLFNHIQKDDFRASGQLILLIKHVSDEQARAAEDLTMTRMTRMTGYRKLIGTNKKELTDC